MEINNKDKICEQINEHINNIIDEGIQGDNINILGKLVDIHKDLANEEYWKKKGEVIDMNYRRRMDFDNYGRDEYDMRRREPRGRYNARERENYRGDYMLEDIMENYDMYMGRGNYRGPETDKAFDYMLNAAEDFMIHLFEESDNEQQIEKIRRTAKKISEMR